MALQRSPGASDSMQAFLPPASHQTPLLTLVWHQDEHAKQDARQVVVTMLQHACGPYGHTVFGDCPGNRSIFWLADQSKFVVTGNLWAFRGYEGFERRWDPIALTEMLTIGFPMAGRTWLSEVRQLQRGRQVRAWSDGRTDVRKLLTPVERQTWSFHQSVQFLRDSLDATVKRLAYRLHRPGALALSGGLDSRLLLASLHTQKLDHYAFTFCDAAQ